MSLKNSIVVFVEELHVPYLLFYMSEDRFVRRNLVVGGSEATPVEAGGNIRWETRGSGPYWQRTG